MTDQHGELDAALERVIEAARHHLAAVRAAQGRVDDDDVWQAYVALNNASFAYDERLLDAFGEVTPWDVDSIDPDEADERFGGGEGAEASDPHPRVISVRQRRDYRVPSVAALLRVGRGGPPRAAPRRTTSRRRWRASARRCWSCCRAGDGSLGALDVPELEPLDGVVMVSEVGTPVDLESFDDDDAVGPFQPAADDRLVGRLDEHPFLELDDDHDHAGHQH